MSATALEPGRERMLLWLLTFTQFTVIMDFMVMMPLAPQLMNAFAVDPAAISKAVSVYAWIGGQFLTSDCAGRIGNYGVNGWLAAMLALAASFWVLRLRAPEAVAAVA